MNNTSPLSTPLRLLIAFVLGVLAGLIMLFFPNNTPLLWWMLVIPVAVLFSAMLLSVRLDPAVRQGTIAPLRPIIALLLFGVIAGAIVVVLAFQPALSWIWLIFMPFAVGLAAAFTFGSYNQFGLAVLEALAAWLGSGISIVINAVLSYIAYEKVTPGGDGGIALPATIVYVVIAFAVAALGGLIGGLFRNWFLAKPSTSPA